MSGMATNDPLKGHYRLFSISAAGLKPLLPAGKPVAVAGSVLETTEVIFERDGVPYIDGDACLLDRSAGGKLDGDFARLVDAVVNRSLG